MSFNNRYVLIIIGAIVGVLMIAFWLWWASDASASVDKITWCHTEPNGNQETLHLPEAALEQAGHVDANGNPLHAGDHAGECVTPTPTVSPTPSPCPPKVSVTPTIEPSVTPTVTPEPTVEPSVTPEISYPPKDTSGTSDGLSSCPDCTKTPTHAVDTHGNPVVMYPAPYSK